MHNHSLDCCGVVGHFHLGLNEGVKLLQSFVSRERGRGGCPLPHKGVFSMITLKIDMALCNSGGGGGGGGGCMSRGPVHHARQSLSERHPKRG